MIEVLKEVRLFEVTGVCVLVRLEVSVVELALPSVLGRF